MRKDAVRFRCNLCSVSMSKPFEWEDHDGACPKCGACNNPSIVPLVDIHFLSPSPKGPIRGIAGRLFVACQPSRQMLATMEGEFFSATGEPAVVTCPRCKGTKAWQMAIGQQEELASTIPEPVKTTVDMGGKKGG